MSTRAYTKDAAEMHSFHPQHTIRAATPIGKLQHDKNNYPGVKRCTKACCVTKALTKVLKSLKMQRDTQTSTMYKQLTRLPCSAVK